MKETMWCIMDMTLIVAVEQSVVSVSCITNLCTRLSNMVYRAEKRLNNYYTYIAQCIIQ